MTRVRVHRRLFDEMRALIESEWPELVHKLPPAKPRGWHAPRPWAGGRNHRICGGLAAGGEQKQKEQQPNG